MTRRHDTSQVEGAMTRRHDTPQGQGARTRRLISVSTGILTGVLIGILTGVLTGVLTGILTGILTGVLTGILTGVLTGILTGILTGMLTGVPAKTADPAHGVPFSRHQEKRRFDSHTINAAVNSAAPTIGYAARRELVVPYISSTPRNTQPTLSAAIP